MTEPPKSTVLSWASGCHSSLWVPIEFEIRPPIFLLGDRLEAGFSAESRQAVIHVDPLDSVVEEYVELRCAVDRTFHARERNIDMIRRRPGHTEQRTATAFAERVKTPAARDPELPPPPRPPTGT